MILFYFPHALSQAGGDHKPHSQLLGKNYAQHCAYLPQDAPRATKQPQPMQHKKKIIGSRC